MFDLIDEAVRNTEHETPQLNATDEPGKTGDLQETDDPEKRDHWHDLRSQAKAIKTGRLDVRFLIATLPDPIDSHSIVDFDSELTALQWAMGEENFLLDRYWLPWSAWLAHKGKEVLPRDYHRHPGAMLFRYAEPPEPISNSPQPFPRKTQFLAVLIVGATATSGVHKVAFAESLDIAAAWDTVEDESHQEPLHVRVLGPAFSGAARSMRLCIEEWMAQHRTIGSQVARTGAKVRFCTGTATARSNQRWLSLRRSEPASLELQFSATVHPDDVALDRMLTYLIEERGIPPERIVVLTEAGTTYTEPLVKHHNRELRGEARPILQLDFPMEIGRLRSEYDKVPELKYGPSGAAPQAPRTGVEILSDVPHFAVDLPPTFSKETVNVAERQLDAILSTISRRDVRVVGIVATDVNDVMFLARQVRQYAPDVQIFSIDNYLLYASPDFFRYTDGMLCVSTYPLFPNSQYWLGFSRKTADLLPFASNAAEGTYNAATILLNEMFKAEGTLGQLRDYRTPFKSSDKPPLWLTMVGRGGLWPVCAWADVEDYKYLEVGEPPGSTEKGPPPVDAPSGIYAALSGLISLACVFLYFLGNRPDRARGRGIEAVGTPWYAAVWAPFAPMPSRTSRRRVALCAADPAHVSMPRQRLMAPGCCATFAFFGGLLLIQYCYSSPLWQISIASVLGLQRLADDGPLVIAWVHGVSITATAALAAAMVAVAHQWVRQRDSGHVRPKEWFLSAVIGVAVLAAAVIWWWPSSDNPRLAAAIFADRLGTYSSGVSPLGSVSLLGAIIAMWGLCHLRRLHFLNYFGFCSPFGSDRAVLPLANPHLAGIDSRIRGLADPLEHFWFRPQRFLDYAFLAFVGLAFTYVFLLRWSGTPEGPIFNAFFVATAAVAVGAIALLHVRMSAASGLFERLLRRFGQHPLSAALERIPQRLASKAAGNVLSAAPHPGDYELSVRLLEQIQRQCREDTSEQIPAEVKQAVSKRFKSADALMRRLMSVQRPERLKAFLYAAALNRELALVCRVLAAQLGDYWSDRTISPAAGGESKPQPEPGRESSWQANAELLVLLQLTHLIRQVFAQIQNMLTFLVVMTLVLLWAFNSYPFQPQRLLMLFSYVLVVWMMLKTLVIFIKFNRDDILSRLAGSTPNQFTWDRSVVLALITYVVLPGLSLIAVQFPEVSQTLFSWIGFVQRALHG